MSVVLVSGRKTITRVGARGRPLGARGVRRHSAERSIGVLSILWARSAGAWRALMRTFTRFVGCELLGNQRWHQDVGLAKLFDDPRLHIDAANHRLSTNNGIGARCHNCAKSFMEPSQFGGYARIFEPPGCMVGQTARTRLAAQPLCRWQISR
jgi:hypothetical protein